MIGMTRANAVNAFGNLRFHWPEYLMEAGELGLYMFSTCAIANLVTTSCLTGPACYR